MLHTALASAAALVALAFALCTLERWSDRRRPHELAWTVALAMFFLASTALAAGAALGWDPVTFRAFYLFGAVANVPVLALGTAHLLAPGRRARAWTAGVALYVAFAAGVVAVAPFTAPLPRTELARGSEVFGPAPRVLAAVGSGVGAAVIVAGAVWSAARRRRARAVVANLLIAVGTVVTGASGLLNSVLDEMTGFAVALVAGIVLIFAGYLVATAAPPRSGAEEEELHEGRPQDEGQQDHHDDRGAAPHAAASRVTASPGRRCSSSAAERLSRATDTIP